ncbi:MAG: magnesium transporter, partial [Ruminococcus sp.]|nr:magnesium transporter [Ruminococcus sp.]
YTGPVSPVLIAMTVSLTLVGTIIMAKVVGSSLPLLASKIGFDPAVMANPLISTVCDSLSLLIYFAVATSVLPQI